MKKINEFKNIETSNKISDEFLSVLAWSIFGIDDEDPWSFNFNSLKDKCDSYLESNNYQYIKLKMEKVIKRLLEEDLDYETGQDIKYKYVEEEFSQKVTRI
jgi:hypothetical protein